MKSEQRMIRDNLLGQRFGRLVVTKLLPRKNQRTMWECVCDCACVVAVAAPNLKRGITKSCGCIRKEMLSERRTRHGKTATIEYRIWAGIRDRCTRPNNIHYKRYGARGIDVCPEWETFEVFFADMGPKPFHNAQIDRINNNKGYSKENCRWVTPSQNMRNTRNNHIVEYNGLRMCIVEWSEKTGIPASRIQNRLCKYKWSVERALTEGATK